jgi:hypothetical protein
MEVKDLISAVNVAGQSLKGVINVLIFIAKFLFLTPWGWILIIIAFISMVVVKIRNNKGDFTFTSVVGGISESLLWFYSNITTILIGIFLVFIVSTVYTAFDRVSASLRLFRQIKTLEATLSNLQSERKVLELTATRVETQGKDRINVNMKFYAWSPVDEKDVESGEQVLTVEGKTLYVDFGVINFKYAQVESGDKINIAFPYQLFSDKVAADNGETLLFTKDGLPLTFSLPADKIYRLSLDDYQEEVLQLIQAATNAEAGRKMGVRSSFSQSFAVTPQPGHVYTFYSTAAGGMVMH